MELNPQFSLIIPTFNSSATLRRCFDSVFAQDYSSFEVLVIDGVSNDDTQTLINEYSQKHNNLFYLSEPDYGIYDAMNKGISRANGAWIYFLGSDDALYSTNVLSLLDAKINQGYAGIIYGNVVIRGDNKWNLNNVVFDGEYTFEKFIDRNICHQAMFYNMDVIKKVGYFDLKYITNADFDYNLRCIAITEFNYIELVIANFFVGGQSSTTDDLLFHKNRGALLMKYFKGRIFSKSFLGARMYIRQAALSYDSPLNLYYRAYCLLAYLKLKALSMIIKP